MKDLTTGDCTIMLDGSLLDLFMLTCVALPPASSVQLPLSSRLQPKLLQYIAERSKQNHPQCHSDPETINKISSNDGK